MNKTVSPLNFFLTLFFFSFLVSGSFGQQIADKAPDTITNGLEAGMADLELKPIRLPALSEVGGSLFLNNDYKLGTVQVSQEKKVTNVPVKFNIYSNAVMVQKEGEEMKLESFDLVTYDETGNDGTMQHIIFRKGYPEIGNQTAGSVYQVLAFGPVVHLLKFLSQKIEDAPTLGAYSRREIVTSEQLYICIPGGEIKMIKKGKKSVMDALPGMAAKIEEAISSGNLNLKSENDLVKLVNTLNQP